LEKDIIAGCIKKERKAQEQLYKSYYGTMAALCLRYTKNENDAVEVLNSGFLKVLMNIQRYDPGKATLYTWIRTIVINSCIDFLKIKERNIEHKELDETTAIQVDAEAINRMKADEVLGLVRQLPPATQAVFNLYSIDGYNHKEIAAMLDISTGTSKWHLSEARKNLQQMIRLQEVKI
jgi:RNA polymerase sigma factor (sigma-70 family)